MTPRILLGVMGRGIQKSSIDSNDWEPTNALVASGERGATLAVEALFNDDDPNGMVGGGWLNLIAGAMLYRKLKPTVVACEFGNRSKYLLDVNGPMGSEIYAKAFKDLFSTYGQEVPINVVVFDEKEWAVEGSSTVQEIHNLFTLALKYNTSEVHLVTIVAHQTRTALIAQRHVLTNPAFANLKVQIHASEVVMLETYPSIYCDRISQVFNSRSFVRTLAMEGFGINKVLAGNTGSYSSVTH